ncbi:isoprene-epoxide--glutathione S-transferase-like [Penaeus japonicus]|uniref:isoprene-epoxide--glutathione S-transferase-like n=1 Tax=Penaeus japonicus TaxID=27405 RepID=UPI001C714297|nr:isoprene-epoxide--glutathione S-transferase-like [Penaeus japonicus]
MANVPLYMRLGMPLFRWKIMRDLRVQGMGKHSPEEVEDMVKKDLAALSLYLGEKPFLMGKEPSEVDCTVFGFLAQLSAGIIRGRPTKPCLKRISLILLASYCA